MSSRLLVSLLAGVLVGCAVGWFLLTVMHVIDKDFARALSSLSLGVLDSLLALLLYAPILDDEDTVDKGEE